MQHRAGRQYEPAARLILRVSFRESFEGQAHHADGIRHREKGADFGFSEIKHEKLLTQNGRDLTGSATSIVIVRRARLLRTHSCSTPHLLQTSSVASLRLTGMKPEALRVAVV